MRLDPQLFPKSVVMKLLATSLILETNLLFKLTYVQMYVLSLGKTKIIKELWSVC